MVNVKLEGILHDCIVLIFTFWITAAGLMCNVYHILIKTVVHQTLLYLNMAL